MLSSLPAGGWEPVVSGTIPVNEGVVQDALLLHNPAPPLLSSPTGSCAPTQCLLLVYLSVDLVVC